MVIRELIESLSQLDPNLRVVVAGYEGGFNDICEITPLTLHLNIHSEWCFGSHGDAEHQPYCDPDTVVSDAIALLGNNTLRTK